jgi:hypothetical protein
MGIDQRGSQVNDHRNKHEAPQLGYGKILLELVAYLAEADIPSLSSYLRCLLP